MKKYQANDPQMTTFVFNDGETTTRLVYSLLAQLLSARLGADIEVFPHPTIRQAVEVLCPPCRQKLVQRYIDIHSKRWANSMAKNHCRYVKVHKLLPGNGMRRIGRRTLALSA